MAALPRIPCRWRTHSVARGTSTPARPCRRGIPTSRPHSARTRSRRTGWARPAHRPAWTAANERRRPPPSRLAGWIVRSGPRERHQGQRCLVIGSLAFDGSLGDCPRRSPDDRYIVPGSRSVSPGPRSQTASRAPYLSRLIAGRVVQQFLVERRQLAGDRREQAAFGLSCFRSSRFPAASERRTRFDRPIQKINVLQQSHGVGRKTEAVRRPPRLPPHVIRGILAIGRETPPRTGPS